MGGQIMRRIFAFLVPLAAACANIPAMNPPEGAMAAPASVPAHLAVGGYAPANPGDPDRAAAEKLAIDEIYRAEPQRSLVESVISEAQVVAGTNYRFTVRMSGMNGYRIVVHKPLQGEMRITSFEKLAAG
jgi:hypothetical protein